MIKAVIFDYYGVFCPRIVPLIAKGTSKQFDVNYKQVKKEIDRLLDLMDENKITFYDYWKTLRLKFKNKNVKLSDQRKIWEDSLKKLKLWPQMVNLAKRLKKSGYKVPVLSNVVRKMAEYNKSKGHYRLFRPVILSYELKMRKPSPSIFRYALKKLKLTSKECVFIDDQKDYLKGAKSVGIHTIQFKNYSQLLKELRRLGINGV